MPSIIEVPSEFVLAAADGIAAGPEVLYLPEAKQRVHEVEDGLVVFHRYSVPEVLRILRGHHNGE